MKWRVAAVVAIAIAACGDNDPAFEVQVYAQPSLVQYRAGDDGVWQTPVVIASDQGWQTYALDGVVADYELEVVCYDGQITYDVQLDATVDDGAQQLQPGSVHYCGTPAPTTPTTFEVTGSYTSAFADVTIGGYGPGAGEAPQHFAIQAPQGTDDLIANDGTNIEILRGLAVDAAMAVPALDLETDGAPLDGVTLVIQGASPNPTGDFDIVEDTWFTDHGEIELDMGFATGPSPGSFAIAPASLRAADDVTELEWIGIGTEAASVVIEGTASLGPTPITIALPSVDGVKVKLGSDDTVSWSGLATDEYSQLQFFLYDRCQLLQRMILASRRFVDLGNNVSFTSSTHAIDPAPVQLTVSTSQSYDGYWTTSSASVAAPQSLTPSPCTPDVP